MNKVCRACRLSKVKCAGSVGGEACSRCARLGLDCVLEARRDQNIARLKPEVKALHKRGRSSDEQQQLVVAQPTPLVKAVLMRCAQTAWARGDTEMMAQVLAHASRLGLPLAAFAPNACAAGPSAPANEPPPYIRELLGGAGGGGAGLCIAYAQVRGDPFWLTSAAFDREVRSRRTLNEARHLSPCEVSCLFSPRCETHAFNERVYARLFASLAPAGAYGSTGADGAPPAPARRAEAADDEVFHPWRPTPGG